MPSYRCTGWHTFDITIIRRTTFAGYKQGNNGVIVGNSQAFDFKLPRHDPLNLFPLNSDH
mgnify:CR=1 FL=1